MTYTREQVEGLLVTTWDETYSYGIEDKTAPDPTMPRAVGNKAHANTLYAHLADIKAAWAHAPLSRREKQALLLRYGMDGTMNYVGFHLGTSRQQAGRVVEQAVGVVTRWLNGEEQEA